LGEGAFGVPNLCVAAVARYHALAGGLMQAIRPEAIDSFGRALDKPLRRLARVVADSDDGWARRRRIGDLIYSSDARRAVSADAGCARNLTELARGR
jgi:hypothetical protein